MEHTGIWKIFISSVESAPAGLFVGIDVVGLDSLDSATGILGAKISDFVFFLIKGSMGIPGS